MCKSVIFHVNFAKINVLVPLFIHFYCIRSTLHSSERFLEASIAHFDLFTKRSKFLNAQKIIFLNARCMKEFFDLALIFAKLLKTVASRGHKLRNENCTNFIAKPLAKKATPRLLFLQGSMSSKDLWRISNTPSPLKN